ncbi:MAG: ABC transporter ATP-binding protein [Acidobacteriota bacterium]
MTSYALRVDQVGKQFQLGATESYSTLRESLTRWSKAPWKKSRDARKSQEASTFWALQEVSFDVEHGEVLGIIGHNGAGKSTLLKILSRITEPTRGSIEVRGRVGSLLEVGTGFHPELTGRENIYLNGAILGMRRVEISRKFDEIVAFAEIEKFLDTPVKRFSSGMYMRLAFAVAAHLDPEILLVDEVLAVGDLAFQNKCLKKMKDVSGAGRTVLLVSHNMGAIHRLCPRCLLLDHGRLVHDGPTEEVVKTYIAHGIDEAGILTQPPNPEKSIHLRRAFTANRDGVHQRDFRYDEGLTVVVELEVNRAIEGCAVWVGIRTVEQVWVLGSADVDSDASRLEVRQPGIYRTQLDLPARWLNAGMYEVIIGITRYSPPKSFDRVELGTFNILDVDTPSRLRTGQSRLGILQPFLDWRLEPIDEVPGAHADEH